MRFFSQFWAPDDMGGPQRPEEPSRQQPPQSRFAGEGQLGGTMSSRLGEALSAMGPGDAADTGGAGIDPTVINPPTFAGETWLAAQEGSQGAMAAGGQPDTFFDQEAELAERRGARAPQRGDRQTDPEAPFREQRNDLHLADIQPEAGTIDNDPSRDDEDHWRP
jgi:hypothetical protein